MSRPVIGFAGMTHLGVNSAAGALERGFEIVGYDADAGVIERLSRGEPPVVEPGLPEILRAHAKAASFTARIDELARCDVVYIASDVPTDDAGTSDLSGIRALIAQVSAVLKAQGLLVVLCQVPPGFTRALAFSPQRLYYQVETLVFGRAVERATRPERFIVGCADPQGPLPASLRDYLAAYGCPVLSMRYESAELAKIAINCCLVSSISVANTLSELCEQIGAVWSEIVPALKLDRRIGEGAYLAPGLGIAGGNLERDLTTVIRLAEEKNTDAGVVRAWVANSRHRRDWAARTAREAVLRRGPGSLLAIWGLAYKENTHSVKNSPSLATIARLQDAVLQVHDPVVSVSQVKHPNVSALSDPLEAARGADALMILTPWPQYRSVPPVEIRKVMRGRVVIDPYAVLDQRAAEESGLTIHTLGRAPLRTAEARHA
jgi:UDPglucose 6-dehydrogenase